MINHDWQLFFQLNTFDPDVLYQQIIRNPEIILNIQQVILQGLRFANQDDEYIQTFCYFNNLRWLLNEYLASCPKDLLPEDIIRQQARNEAEINKLWLQKFQDFEDNRKTQGMFNHFADVHYQRLLQIYHKAQQQHLTINELQYFIHSSLLVQRYKHNFQTYQE